MAASASAQPRLRLLGYGSNDRIELLFTEPNDELPSLRGSTSAEIGFHRVEARLDSQLEEIVHQRLQIVYGITQGEQNLFGTRFDFLQHDFFGRAEWKATLAPAVILRTGFDFRPGKTSDPCRSYRSGSLGARRRGAGPSASFRRHRTRIETRFIHRYGPGEDDFIFATYAWNAEGSEAQLLTGGQPDALGTEHDIPDASACKLCHGHLPERVLGFGAIQLSHEPPGLTLDELVANAALSDPPTRAFVVPGDDVERLALGYLHANCGGCHTPEVSAGFSVFSTRLRVTDLAVEDTDTFQEALGVPVRFPPSPEVTHRIAPGDPAASAVWFRMASRDPFTQMPPLATEIVDDAGLLAVEAWIIDLGN